VWHIRQLVANKEFRSVKWVFLSLTAGLTALGFFGMGRPADQPTVEIEGRHVPIQFVHVFSDGPGAAVVAEYRDIESQIDYSERIPRAKGRAITDWQEANRIGQNYVEMRLAGKRHRK
jgi:hypothetical protein